MFDFTKATRFNTVRLGYFAAGILSVWTIFIALSMTWNYRAERSAAIEAARIEARTAYEKDVLYRRWNANLGGVYAEATASTQPNPYLEVPERDILTPSNRKLTLINPAYMTRQAHELAMQTMGVRGHITSLNCIRPENEPDKWEHEALLAFQSGAEEHSAVQTMDGQPYMRLMRPLKTEKGCLACHAAQGYKAGDIRGGISVSVPLSPFLAIHNARRASFLTLYAIIWLAGLAAVSIGSLIIHRQLQYRLRSEAESRNLAKLQGVLEMSGAVCHELNQPMQAITGFSELMLMGIEKDNPLYRKAHAIFEQVQRMSTITAKLMAISRYACKDYRKGKIIDIDKASQARLPDFDDPMQRPNRLLDSDHLINLR